MAGTSRGYASRRDSRSSTTTSGCGLLCLLATVGVVVVLTAGCNPGTVRRSSHSPSATHSVPATSAGGTKVVLVGLEGPEQYDITVTALYRDGPFTRLGFTLTCLKVGSRVGDGDVCDPGTYLSRELQVGANYGGFYLVDPVAHKEYRPVRAGEDPFTSEAPHVARGKSFQGWVVFPTVGKNAKTLDVVIPHGPVLENTPIGQPKPQTQQAPVQEDFGKPKDTTDTAGLELPVFDLRLHTTSEGTDEKQSKDRKDVTLAADVLFAFDKTTLTSKAKTILDRVAAQMDQDATGTIDVTGYTDAKGSPRINGPLSKNRAKAVSDYLRSKVERDLSYSVTGKGEADPVAPNTNDDGSDNPKGRAKNRRVTVSYRTRPADPTATRSPSATAKPSKQPAPINWTTSSPGGDDTYRVAVQQVRRHGDMAALQVTMTCEKTPLHGCDPTSELTGDGGTAAQSDRGFTLYQPESKTRYYAVIDDDEWEWTMDVGAIPLPVHTELAYWVYFPAPDPGVTSIDVRLPHDGPTVRDVPVA